MIFIITTIVCAYITFNNMNDIPIKTYGTVYIVNEYADTYYEMLSDNVGITTINGISNVFVNMESDGYSIYKSDITESYVDVSFVKDGAPSYRFYFTYPEGRITFFCSEYENSYTALSYINERRE